MSKTAKTPASVLKSLMDEYQLTAFSLSKAISLSNSAVQQILKGKNKVTVTTALRLSKFFGQTPAFWLDLQRETDLSEAAQDKELSDILKGIAKAKKPAGPPSGILKGKAKKPAGPPKAKNAKKATLAGKRKAAAKVPGAKAKAASRKPKSM